MGNKAAIMWNRDKKSKIWDLRSQLQVIKMPLGEIQIIVTIVRPKVTTMRNKDKE